MWDIQIRDLKFDISEVGNFFKSSKCIYTWQFVLDEIKRKIELAHSRLTGKRIINLNGKELVKCRKFTYSFTYSFPLDKHYLNITQTAPDIYELRIDNISFLVLLNKQKVERFNILREERDRINEEKQAANRITSKNNYQDQHTKPTTIPEVDENFFSGYDNKFNEEVIGKETGMIEAEGFDFDENTRGNIGKNQNSDWDIQNNPGMAPITKDEGWSGEDMFKKSSVVNSGEVENYDGKSNTNAVKKEKEELNLINFNEGETSNSSKPVIGVSNSQVPYIDWSLGMNTGNQSKQSNPTLDFQF